MTGTEIHRYLQENHSNILWGYKFNGTTHTFNGTITVNGLPAWGIIKIDHLLLVAEDTERFARWIVGQVTHNIATMIAEQEAPNLDYCPACLNPRVETRKLGDRLDTKDVLYIEVKYCPRCDWAGFGEVVRAKGE